MTQYVGSFLPYQGVFQTPEDRIKVLLASGFQIRGHWVRPNDEQWHHIWLLTHQERGVFNILTKGEIK